MTLLAHDKLVGRHAPLEETEKSDMSVSGNIVVVFACFPLNNDGAALRFIAKVLV